MNKFIPLRDISRWADLKQSLLMTFSVFWRVSCKTWSAGPITESNCKKRVGLATDGISANIAAIRLKGLVEQKLSWIFWMWCLAHRLELAIKNALKGIVFDQIDDMLLKLYYLYKKSPKKCQELTEINTNLQNCLTFDDGGRKPVKASGTCWIAHKLSAMKHIISKYGAYTNHLAALSRWKQNTF